MQHGSITVFTFGVMECSMKNINLICAHVKRVIAGIVELPTVLVHNTVLLTSLQVGKGSSITS